MFFLLYTFSIYVQIQLLSGDSISPVDLFGPQARPGLSVRLSLLATRHFSFVNRLPLSNELLQAHVERLHLCWLGITTPSPTDATFRVYKVHITDLGVHHAHSLLERLRKALLHQEVPRVLMDRQLAAHAPHEHLDQGRLHTVLFQIDIHHLRKLLVLGQDLRKPGVLRRPSERPYLCLCPDAGEQFHDADLAL